jgi:hypothetical protein
MDTIVALLRWIVYGAEHDRGAVALTKSLIRPPSPRQLGFCPVLTGDWLTALPTLTRDSAHF